MSDILSDEVRGLAGLLSFAPYSMVDGRVGDMFAVAAAVPHETDGRQITVVTSDIRGEYVAAYRAHVTALGRVGIGRARQDFNTGKGLTWEDPRDLLDAMSKVTFNYFKGERRQEVLGTMTAITLQLLEESE